MKLKLSLILLLGLLAGGSAAWAESHWYKGNLHTHSLWSDGDDYPDMITAWYKDHGYNFLALSDHNVMLAGDKWITVTNKARNVALEKYAAKFGTNWVEQKEQNGVLKVRLKTLENFRAKFEEENRFLLIPGEEISDYLNKVPIHMNATNLREPIKPQGGSNAFEVLQNNIRAVLDQRKATGQPMIPHINHPNFRWALTAEDIMRVMGERFVEVYNGHPITMNLGDTNHASHERIWDIVLTRRLAELKLDPMWGTAVDDSHSYHEFKVGHSNPGRGWIMVRASALTPAAIIAAMEKGDFYASSGVRLKDVRRGTRRLSLEIEAEPGVTYKTQFIGTRKNYDPTSEAVMENGKPINTTRRYSKDIGTVLAEVEGVAPAYTLKGDEVYVRAKVISSKAKENPAVEGDLESAWVQPLVPGKK